MDRQIACLAVREALRQRILRDVGTLDATPLPEILALCRLLPSDAAAQLAAYLAEGLEEGRFDEGQSVHIVDALLSQDRPRWGFQEVGLALVGRGHVAQARRLLSAMDHPFEHVRLARALVAVTPDDDTRVAMALQAWRTVARYPQLDVYGPCYTLALWLETTRLWPPGHAEARSRLRDLERRLAMLTPSQLEASQDYDDLRVLAALGWAGHGDATRALRWYAALGDDRHAWCKTLAPALPEEVARSLCEEAILEELRTCLQAARDQEEPPFLPHAFDVLTVAPASVASWALAEGARVLADHDDAWAQWSLALLPHLPRDRARTLWEAQRARLATLAADAAPPELDALLEAVLGSAASLPDVWPALLPWVSRWPRPEPLEALDDWWPADARGQLLQTLLARPDVNPGGPWQGLVADLVDTTPTLRASLPPAWAEALRPPAPRPPHVHLEPRGFEVLLMELPAASRPDAVARYAEAVTGWSEAVQREVLTRVSADEEATTTIEDETDRPRQVWARWLDEALAQGDDKGLRGLFPLVTSQQDIEWLSRTLLTRPGPLKSWIAHLAERRAPLTLARAMVWCLDGLEGSPSLEAALKQARQTCLAALDRSLREILCSREGPDIAHFHPWFRIIRWLSADRAIDLWSWRARGVTQEQAPLYVTGLLLAIRVGGVPRLSAALRSWAAMERTSSPGRAIGYAGP
ncbi:MAG: hypothetical protein H6738_10035 [Alphaproteobacteria bacterium]|nr:hypothetical protein [Alphaproteobacteria bacterium]